MCMVEDNSGSSDHDLCVHCAVYTMRYKIGKKSPPLQKNPQNYIISGQVYVWGNVIGQTWLGLSIYTIIIILYKYSRATFECTHGVRMTRARASVNAATTIPTPIVAAAMRARVRSTPLPPLWPPTSSSCSTRHAPPPPPRPLIPPHCTALSLSFSNTHIHTDRIFSTTHTHTHTRARARELHNFFIYSLSKRHSPRRHRFLSRANSLSISSHFL